MMIFILQLFISFQMYILNDKQEKLPKTAFVNFYKGIQMNQLFALTIYMLMFETNLLLTL